MSDNYCNKLIEATKSGEIRWTVERWAYYIAAASVVWNGRRFNLSYDFNEETFTLTITDEQGNLVGTVEKEDMLRTLGQVVGRILASEHN